MALENWDWLIELAEAGNFTKAAESLQISQQALSARLATLEKDVDAKLFVRSVPLTLTPAGMAFLLYAREQRQAQRDMLRQIGEETGSGAGTLKVGISLMRGRLIMPRVVKTLTAQMPSLCVHLAEGTNRELLRMAERGEVDAVVARFGTSHPDIRVTPLYEEEVVLAVRADLLEAATGMPPAEAREAVADQGLRLLAKCPFVMGTIDDISGRIAYSELRNAGISPKVVATSESAITLLSMVAEGIGAAFTPSGALAAPAGLSPLTASPLPGLSTAARKSDTFAEPSEPDTLAEPLSSIPFVQPASAPTPNQQEIVLIPLSRKAKYTISLGIPPRTEPWYATSAFEEALARTLKETHAHAPQHPTR